MQITNKIFSFDTIIFVLLFGLLPIDMLNGYLLREVGVSPPITIAQLYKTLLLGLVFIRVNSTEKVIFLSIFSLLLLPTAYQVVKSFNIQLIFTDTVKITKYLGSVLAFFYFRSIFINKGHLLKWVYRWILFSFIILVVNIFLKLLGIGFPMYVLDTIEIGSKGFFYAGNEVSAVLIILSSFLMYWYQFHDKKMLFIIVGALAVLTGLYLTSKTAILGTVFTFFYFFIFNPNRNKSSIKKKLSFLLSFFILLPLGLYIIVEYLKTSDVMQRFSYFWNELDIYTFILSNRNTFLFDFIEIFKKEYNIIEMIIGVGQSTFETLNNNHIIELDFFDIYFAYGIIGILLFLFYISFLLIQSKIKSLNRNTYLFSSYSKYIAILLIALSFLSGHVFNSGMAAIYIGCVFSLMYYKSKHENQLS
ncbi:MAG: hypothetical protein ACI8ZH_000503 [Flavobacteriales bacterium]